MEFALSEEQAELAATVRSLLDRRADSAAVRTAMAPAPGHDEALWRTLCEQIGVAALAVPEEHGGAGFTLFESFVVLEELGRSLAPSPLLGSLMATAALLAAGDDDARADLLPRIAAGEVATFALDDVPVWHGDSASVVLAVREGALVLVEDGVRATPAVDPTIRLAALDLTGATTRVLGADGDAARAAARLAGIAGAACLAVGCLQRGLDLTVAHSLERVQFGRQIGSFQALKHRMADMLVRVEMSRSAAYAAAYAVSAGVPDAGTRAAVAAAYLGDAAPQVAREVVQLHGGIAITWEHDAHLVLKRAHTLTRLFGPPHEHRAAVLATGLATT